MTFNTSPRKGSSLARHADALIAYLAARTAAGGELPIEQFDASAFASGRFDGVLQVRYPIRRPGRETLYGLTAKLTDIEIAGIVRQMRRRAGGGKQP